MGVEDEKREIEAIGTEKNDEEKQITELADQVENLMDEIGREVRENLREQTISVNRLKEYKSKLEELHLFIRKR